MPLASIFAFAILYAAAFHFWQVPHAAGLVYVVASIVCFVAYARDKSAAQAGRRRTPESTLLLLGLLCGWPGAVLARHWLRHKSGKAAYLAPFWASVAVNVAAFASLAWPGSFLRAL